MEISGKAREPFTEILISRVILDLDSEFENIILKYLDEILSSGLEKNYPGTKFSVDIYYRLYSEELHIEGDDVKSVKIGVVYDKGGKGNYGKVYVEISWDTSAELEEDSYIGVEMGVGNIIYTSGKISADVGDMEEEVFKLLDGKRK